MPKRDENYMQSQRDAIARAAREVLVEKGYYDTSLRDICRAAGVSNGALYSYFPTREAAIIAACAVDHAEQQEVDLPNSWDEYIQIPAAALEPGEYRSKRIRLSLQFAAEISQMAEVPEGLPILYENQRAFVRRRLEWLKGLGIVTLPLGLEQTTDVHIQLFTGFQYQLMMNRSEAREACTVSFVRGLALTAGLVE